MSRYSAAARTPVNPGGDWARASSDLTWSIEDVTSRQDLIVTMSPDAGYDDTAYDEEGKLIDGASRVAARTFLEKGIIEISPDLLPPDFKLARQLKSRDFPDKGQVKLDNFRPRSRQDRKRYPVLWGAVIHEAAHASYSRWVTEANRKALAPQERQWMGAALFLEESRIEKRQVTARPQDQPWIEAAVMQVAVSDYAHAVAAAAGYKKKHPGTMEAILSRYTCGRAAALILARVAAGSLFPGKDITAVGEMASAVFGGDYAKLEDIWGEAQECADEDLDAMLSLGHRWYDLTRDCGDDTQVMGVALDPGDGKKEEGVLSGILRAGAARAAAEASGKAAEDRRNARAVSAGMTAAREAARQQDAAREAARALGAGEPGTPYHPVTGYREPSPEEKNLARVTRDKLRNAYIPEKAVTPLSRALPPGRLSVRAAQQGCAQRAAGMASAAQPFRYARRRHVSTPPLKVGILQDVSASQEGAAAAAVSGAWSLAHAADGIPGTTVAMVSFGNAVHSVISPRTRLPGVPVLSANAGTAYFSEALAAIEGQLDLARSGAARLVVILTDGELNTRDTEKRDGDLARVTGMGVRILWVNTDGDGRFLPARMPGLRICDTTSGDYSLIPGIICHQAVEALGQ